MAFYRSLEARWDAAQQRYVLQAGDGDDVILQYASNYPIRYVIDGGAGHDLVRFTTGLSKQNTLSNYRFERLADGGTKVTARFTENNEVWGVSIKVEQHLDVTLYRVEDIAVGDGNDGWVQLSLANLLPPQGSNAPKQETTTMTNITKYYTGVSGFGNWFQKIAAELGKTPTQLYIEAGKNTQLSLPTLVKSHSLGAGSVTAQLLGDITLTAQFVPSTQTVTEVKLYSGAQLMMEWKGQMSAQQFLAYDWPESVIYGSSQMDFLDAWAQSTVYAGAGNDVIDLWGNGCIVYGQEGNDVFLVDGVGSMTIGDYHAGDKIVFYDYNSLAELAADFLGIQSHGSGFTAMFKQASGQEWSLRFENLAVSQLRLEDLNFADTATLVGVWQPFMTSFGINASAFSLA